MGAPRGQGADVGDGLGHDLDRAVDVGVGGRGSDRQANGRTRPVAIHTHREQHVGGLEATGGASGTGRTGDARLIDSHQQGLAFGVVEGDVQGRRKSLVRACIAIDHAAGDALEQMVLQAVAQRRRSHPEVVAAEDGGVKEVPNPDKNEPVLTHARAAILSEVSRRLTDVFPKDNPLDIEWLFAGDVLYIVQSRPYVTAR